MKTIFNSPRGHLAAEIMVVMARHWAEDKETRIRVSDISTQINVSIPYIEMVIADLRKRGFIRSFRGPGGGYILMRDPADINMAEIFSAGAKRLERSGIKAIYKAIDEAAIEKLSTISLLEAAA